MSTKKKSKALRDKPVVELRKQVRDELQDLIGALIRATAAAHSASVILTLTNPEGSDALGTDLEVVAKRLNFAGQSLAKATSAWMVLVDRAKKKAKKQ
jgi:hypothetical protein